MVLEKVKIRQTNGFINGGKSDLVHNVEDFSFFREKKRGAGVGGMRPMHNRVMGHGGARMSNL